MSYTYLIGWSEHNRYYYGVRYSKHANPDELWVTYKTSSKYVWKFAEEHGCPDVIQVRRVFHTKESAIAWESKVLKRLRVVSDSKYLNRWDNNMVPLNLDGPYPFEDSSVQDKVDDTLRNTYGGRGSGSSIIKERVETTNSARYGTYHTLFLEKTVKSREDANIEKFGHANPFDSPELQERIRMERYERTGYMNPMDDPLIRQKHKESAGKFDRDARKKKTFETNMQRYGITNTLNTPELIEKRKLDVTRCPICENKKYAAGNFYKHMDTYHGWDKTEIREYRNAHKKN